jgi:2-C-methyl-D-erythritol 4-phosphate cytidylyltransferase
VIEKTIESGNAIPVVKINESIRRLEFDNSYAVNRKDYMLVQTPQCFRTELLKKAYEQDFSETFTDDASVVEALGEKINLVDGNFENIKITRPVDLKFAKAYLK